MKISSSEVAFRTLHNREDSHHYEQKTHASAVRSRSGLGVGTGLTLTETVTDLSYQAKMRHREGNSLSSQSVITQNGQSRTLENTRNIETLTRTTLGLDAQSVRFNFQLPVQTQSLNLQQAQVYQNVSQLNQAQTQLTAISATASTNARVDITEQHFYKEAEKLQVNTQEL
ncbi:hypothetical protein [Aliamphritea spongicola]|nr:hypothetical protein [Aliamphritea spongicola]